MWRQINLKGRGKNLALGCTVITHLCLHLRAKTEIHAAICMQRNNTNSPLRHQIHEEMESAMFPSHPKWLTTVFYQNWPIQTEWISLDLRGWAIKKWHQEHAIINPGWVLISAVRVVLQHNMDGRWGDKESKPHSYYKPGHTNYI